MKYWKVSLCSVSLQPPIYHKQSASNHNETRILDLILQTVPHSYVADEVVKLNNKVVKLSFKKEIMAIRQKLLLTTIKQLLTNSCHLTTRKY